MACGCGKKKGASAANVGPDAEQLVDPIHWGPILWKYLHCLAEKIGTSSNKIIDTDQANYMETMLTMIPLILPCLECQAHATTYVAANPIPVLRGLYGAALQETVRTWLFLFHTAVRASKVQPILVNTIHDCMALYAGCMVPKCEYTSFVQSVATAVRKGWVRIDNWKKWYSYSERLRLITGNIVSAD